MAGSPQFKAYDANGEYVAAFKDIYDAARFTATSDTGSSIRDGHGVKRTIWTQWHPWEDAPVVAYGVVGDAGESYDAVADAWHAQKDREESAYRAELERARAAR